ncbi:MAG: hypothetical protein KKC18_05680 [Chloroflexi bacterium]|nr:hypothetical protein [Chloroflexota bacterium]
MKDKIETREQQIAELETTRARRQWIENAIQWNRIWLPTAAMFVLLCILTWLDEILDLPHLLLGSPRTPINWQEAIIEVAMIGIVGILAVSRLVHTIIKLKRAEETLRQYTTELEARNKELDAFAHTVAHDLKNPLSLVVGFAETLEREDYATPLDDKLRRYLYTIAHNMHKMNSIIDELLLLAQVRQMEKVKMWPLNMASIIAEAQKRLVSLIEEHQAEIILPDAWIVALGYEPWVEEVWANYISNGIKYGGRPPHVELGATAQADSMVRFWVRDNGAGLTPEEQARLFMPFAQLNQTHAKGYGLGLSIVQRIVEKLGGQVGVESEIGQGSVFSFTSPGVRAEGGAASPG